jgi:hypothetical protein
MFWREVLEHASSDNAIDSVVILSNDRKNDWLMGGGSNPPADTDMLSLRKDWAPIPLVHPMLLYEANYRAGVDSVMVVDSGYLAVLFRKTAVPSNNFVDAAIIIELPDEKREDRDIRKRKSRAAIEATSGGPNQFVPALRRSG